jgi:hypothetical protein
MIQSMNKTTTTTKFNGVKVKGEYEIKEKAH